MKKINITIGQKFNRLTVIDIYKNVGKRRYALFLCDCGNTTVSRCDSVQLGTTYSCGCYQKEVTSKRSFVHGESYTNLYRIWEGMKQRCQDKNASNYHNYGGRGIKVCDDWNKYFVLFKSWSIKNGYKPKLSIDRINVNGNYEPSNCRWATSKEQGGNRRNNVKYKGEIANDASIRLGGKRHLVVGRIYKGWSYEKAFTTPVKN